MVCIELTGSVAQKEEKGGGPEVSDAVCGHFRRSMWSYGLENPGTVTYTGGNHGSLEFEPVKQPAQTSTIYDIGLTWN